MKLIYLVILLSLVSFSGHANSISSNEVMSMLTDVVDSERFWIQEFFEAKNDEVFKACVIKENDELFVVFKDDSGLSAVLFDLKKTNGQWVVINRGFGQFKNEQWEMWSKKSGITFESHGGIWTVDHYRNMIVRASECSQYYPVRWKSVKVLEGKRGEMPDS